MAGRATGAAARIRLLGCAVDWAVAGLGSTQSVGSGP